MAQQILLTGAPDFDYLRWAAGTADPELRTRIHELIDTIRAGTIVDPSCWPTVEECAPLLDHEDEVVAIMAAQSLQHKLQCEHVPLEPALQQRTEALLSQARQRPWFIRYGPVD